MQTSILVRTATGWARIMISLVNAVWGNGRTLPEWLLFACASGGNESAPSIHPSFDIAGSGTRAIKY